MGAMRDLWLRWKMLKLPWRKTFLIGQDLSGNTFWEFRTTPNTMLSSSPAHRLRRIVRPLHKTQLSDVVISPQWHQWLRQTRVAPPTIQEQHADLARQAQLKISAAEADRRWEGKERYFPAEGGNKQVEGPTKRKRVPLPGASVQPGEAS